MSELENNVVDFKSIPTLNQSLYCYIDFKSLTILPPFLAQNDEDAKRNFSSLVNYSNSALCKFPADFHLYKIGDYVCAFTGEYEKALSNLRRFILNSGFQLITSGDKLAEPDTDKYKELQEKVDKAVINVTNSNNVLNEQIGKVPNLQEAINKLNSQFEFINNKIVQFADQIEAIEHKYNCDIKISSRKHFLDKLFQ